MLNILRSCFDFIKPKDTSYTKTRVNSVYGKIQQSLRDNQHKATPIIHLAEDTSNQIYTLLQSHGSIQKESGFDGAKAGCILTAHALMYCSFFHNPSKVTEDKLAIFTYYKYALIQIFQNVVFKNIPQSKTSQHMVLQLLDGQEILANKALESVMQKHTYGLAPLYFRIRKHMGTEFTKEEWELIFSGLQAHLIEQISNFWDETL